MTFFYTIDAWAVCSGEVTATNYLLKGKENDTMRKGKYWSTKRSLSLALAGVLTFFNLQGVTVQADELQAAAQSEAAQLYVSLTGREGASGTKEDPFDSLEAARDAIRLLKNTEGLPDGGITVNIRGGEYALLEDSFVLEQQDSGTASSPVTWKAYDGEDVKFVGNMVVSGSKFMPVTDSSILDRLPDEAKEKVLMYDLAAENGLTVFSPIPKNGYGWPAEASSMSVLVDGETQTLSRYPNQGFISINSIQSCGFVPRDHVANPDGSCPQCTKEAGGSTRIPCKYGESEFMKQPGGVFTTTSAEAVARYDLWAQESDIWTAGYFCWDWADDSCAISSVENTGSGIQLTMKQPSRYGVKGSGRKFYVYNMLCEIDQPGEWYLDRDHAKLYLYPAKDISTSNVELSIQTQPLVAMNNVSYVDWQGVTFAKSNGHGITMLDCDHVEIAGCSFRDLGQRAVCIGDPNATDINTGAGGGSDNTVRSCDITRTGQGGVFVGGGNRYRLTPGNNKVVNCDISDYAVIKRTYSPAVELVGCGNSAERNEIYDAPHLAIQFKGNDMLIYGNDIHDVCYETADCGAIYSVRRWSWQGTLVKNNFIHDLVNTGGIGSAAVYVDDLGSGVTMTENLFVNIPGYTTLFGGGRDNVITNNIQINQGNGKGLHYDNRGQGWAWYHAAGPDGECYGELVALRENADYDAEVWNAKYPGLAAIDLDTVSTRTDKGDGYKNYYSNAAMPANALIEKNIMVGVANPFGNVNSNVKSYGTFDEKTNVSYAIGTDIGLADADSYDFEVLEDSKIKEMMGDNHFHVEDMGLYNDAYRTLVETQLEAPVLSTPADGEDGLIATNGIRFTWEEVDGAGRYKLEIASDPAFENIVKTVSTEAVTVSVNGLEKETTYYWRVTARESAVNGVQSSSGVRSFTTSSVEDPSFFEGFRNFDEWEIFEDAGGSKGTPSNTTANAHSGRYSYELNEGMDVIQKVFGTKHNDVASVWLYDNMNKGRGAAAIVQVTREEGGSNVWIGAGVSVATNGGHMDNYVVRIGGTWYDTEVVRTQGWHELKFDYSAEGTCVIYIDGVSVYTVEDAPYYDRIVMGDFWNHAGYAGDISGMLFDDVTVGNPVIREKVLEIRVPEESIRLTLDETYEIHPIVETNPDVDAPVEYAAQEWEIAKVDESGVITPVRPGSTVITVSSVSDPAVKAELRVEVLNQINLAQLQNLYDTLMGYARADYTQESWKVLEEALVKAYETLHSDVVTVEMRDQAVAALTMARDGLVDARSNIVGENFGFESGTTEGFDRYPTNGDGGVTVTAVNDAAHTGEYSALVTTKVFAPYNGTSGYYNMGLMYTIPGDQVQAGVQYEVSFWTKTADGMTRNMCIRSVFRSKDGSSNSDYVSVGQEWTKVTCRTNVVPEGLDRLEFVLGNQNVAGQDGQYYIDDVKISVVTPSVSVENIRLDQEQITMKKDSTVTLTATVEPAQATNDTVVWSTSDSNVAVVKDGVVTAVGCGTAQISVTALDGEYTAVCTVVVPVPVSGIVIGCSSMTVAAGTDFTLQAAVLPVDASNKKVTWSSSDETIATVDENGHVTAVEAGETMITVTTEEGGFTATCSLTVKPGSDVSGGDISGGDVSGGDVSGGDSDVEKISLDVTDKMMKKGESLTLHAVIEPEGAETSLLWYSSDTSVAVVQDGVVTAVGTGKVVIVVTSLKGGLAATCTITVEEETLPDQPEEPVKPGQTEEPSEPENSGESAEENKTAEPGMVEEKRFYTVVKGDTLNRIAARNGLTLNELLAMNPQIGNPNRIFIGQQIVIGRTLTDKNSAQSTVQGEIRYYVVKKGDTLNRIAKKNHVSIAQLRAWNREIFAQKYIYSGQKIRIR